jgi:hypothetical protein
MMKRIVTIASSVVLLLIFGHIAMGQEKHKVTSRVSGEKSKYTIQHTIDVGDLPGHKIRIAELRRTYTTQNPLQFIGIRVLEEYARFFADHVNFSGRHWGYGIYYMENGDKIFSTFDGNTHTSLLPGRDTKGTYSGTTTLTGGTGKFQGIRGTGKYTGRWDPTKDFNVVNSVFEYWSE